MQDRVKELIDSGAIGDIRLVNIELFQGRQPEIVRGLDNNWRVNPEVSGGGFFYDLGSHQLDFLDYLFGPIKSANGIAENQAGDYQAEDIVSANFRFKNGVIGSGIWSFAVAPSAAKEETVIIGDKGEIRFSYFTATDVT